MDESAIRILVASLEVCRSTLHWWLGFWTFLVVAGVALEIVFVVWEYVEELHDFNRGIVHPPERPSGLLFALGLLGAALVAIGVAGELYAESKIETVETRIRKANDELFSLLSKEAGDAMSSARDAQESAEHTKAIADELVREVTALSPRILTLDQQRKIAATLKTFSGHPSVTVESYGMDGEGTALATQLISVLHAAIGVPIGDRRAGFIVSGGFEWGISIRGPESELPFMTALQKSLTEIGKLSGVTINGLMPAIGAAMGGNAGIGGRAGMGGGGGPPRKPVIPSSGPVEILVGIKPPTVLPIGGG